MASDSGINKKRYKYYSTISILDLYNIIILYKLDYTYKSKIAY